MHLFRSFLIFKSRKRFSFVGVGNKCRRDLNLSLLLPVSSKGAEPQQVTTSTPLPTVLRGLPLTSPPSSPVITMLRAVFLQALPRLCSPAVRRYSAAAIPVPNTRPDVHFNKVKRSRTVSLKRHQYVRVLSLVPHFKPRIYRRVLTSLLFY